MKEDKRSQENADFTLVGRSVFILLFSTLSFSSSLTLLQCKTLSNDSYRNGGPFRFPLLLAMLSIVFGSVQLSTILRSFPGTNWQSETSWLDPISLIQWIT